MPPRSPGCAARSSRALPPLRSPPARRKGHRSRPVDSFLDLKVGDYVVHVAHGIAKFTGMQTIAKDGKSEEYLTLRFAENATLHVPRRGST
jgi:transcription-repair coupling factor (superfamily II helicase)